MGVMVEPDVAPGRGRYVTSATTNLPVILKLAPVNVLVTPGAESRCALVSADTREGSPKRFENLYVALRALRLSMSSHERIAGALRVIEGMYPEVVAVDAVTGGAIPAVDLRGELVTVRALVAGLTLR